MAYFRCGGGGIPSSLKSGMNDVLNKKFGTSTTYPPADWPDTVNLMGPLPEKTVSGAIASFSDGADDVPIKSASFGIVASGGNGTPSTPIPIVGASSVTVYHTGKNLIDNSADAWENGTINSSGNNASGSGTRTIGYFDIKGGLNYKISGVIAPETASDFRIFFYDKNKDFLTYRNYNSTPTIPENACFFRVRNISIADISALQIEYGSTATAYEAYKSKTPITIQLGQTVYGGTLAEDGTLTVTNGYLLCDGSDDETWVYNTSGGYNRFYIDLADGLVPESGRGFVLSNRGEYGTQAGSEGLIFRYRQSATVCRLFYYPPQTIDNVADFRTWLSNNNLEVVYPLATPIVITGLDEISISTYLGDNNIWCDSGDSDVTYRADIQLALNS